MQESVKLPRGVRSFVTRHGKRVYYWHPHRGTAMEEKRVRLPDDPASPAFWIALKAAQERVPARGGFAAMVDAYLESPAYTGLKPATKREYGRYLAEARRDLGGFAAGDIQPHHVAAYRDARSKRGRSAADRWVSAMRALYSFGVERGFANANPARAVKRIAKVEPYQPWPAAAVAAIEAMRPELRAACLLGLWTGQRLGDVLAMKLTDVADGRITVRQQKTGKALVIPLAGRAVEVVAAARTRGHFHLVSKPDGQPFTVDQFHAAWGRELKRPEAAAIRAAGVSFHGLRKRAVVNLVEAGCTASEAAAITGQTLQVLDHYARGASQPRLAATAMKKMEDRE